MSTESYLTGYAAYATRQVVDLLERRLAKAEEDGKNNIDIEIESVKTILRILKLDLGCVE